MEEREEHMCDVNEQEKKRRRNAENNNMDGNTTQHAESITNCTTILNTTEAVADHFLMAGPGKQAC